MKRILILIIMLSPITMLAQTMWYEGGKGDGHDNKASNSFTAQLTSSAYAYVGGKSDGHSEAMVQNYSPTLIPNFVPYAGGNNDGHASVTVTNFQPNLIDNFYPYQGGIADGDASVAVNNFQPTLVNNFYAYVGGIGDGWSNALAQSVSLPLVLLSFEGQAMGDHNLLNWKTSIEENVDYFLVEKSRDGVEFASIGNVNAVGNSSEEQSYDYKDREDVQGANYYKLKMTDIDNSYTYSKVIKLINEKQDFSVILAPNPAKNNISIRLSRAMETSSQFMVLDMSGKVVLKKTISKDEAVKNIDIESLVPGQYMIYLNLANDKMSLPFIKK